MSVTPLVFALACVTTGGPATDVTWSNDGYVVSNEQQQVVTDYKNSTYLNEIIFNDTIIAGDYGVNVSNDVSSITSTLSISGINDSNC